MTEQEFTVLLDRDGFREQERRRMPGGMSNTDHVHDWDARLLVLEGSLTVSFADGAKTFLPGEYCTVPTGVVHHEVYSDGGSEVYIGRRK
jgi:quercetin dioxygenase-like cupin family protein